MFLSLLWLDFPNIPQKDSSFEKNWSRDLKPRASNTFEIEI